MQLNVYVVNSHMLRTFELRATLFFVMAAFNHRRRLFLLLLLVRQRMARRRPRTKKRTWVRQINRRRESLGEFHSLIQEMRLFDHDVFYRYFRMMPSWFDQLLSLVDPRIQCQDTSFRSTIPAAERLSVTLRYLVTGDSMQTIAFSYRMGHSMVCTIIPETCDAIWHTLAAEYLKSPSTPEDWKRISESYGRIWNFPHCIGAIDGKRGHAGTSKIRISIL